jgi:hypothetical protein
MRHTNNGSDFLALLRAVDFHPGLIVVLENVRRDEQMECFRSALNAICDQDELTNHVVEVDGRGRVRIFGLPAS